MLPPLPVSTNKLCKLWWADPLACHPDLMTAPSRTMPKQCTYHFLTSSVSPHVMGLFCLANILLVLILKNKQMPFPWPRFLCKLLIHFPPSLYSKLPWKSYLKSQFLISLIPFGTQFNQVLVLPIAPKMSFLSRSLVTPTSTNPVVISQFSPSLTSQAVLDTVVTIFFLQFPLWLPGHQPCLVFLLSVDMSFSSSQTLNSSKSQLTPWTLSLFYPHLFPE